MGVSTSPQQMAAKLDRFAKDVGNTRIPLNITALEAKKTFAASAAASGVLGAKIVGKRKAIGVRYTIKGRGQTASATVTYTGPAHLVNNPTRPHRIEPRRGRGRRQARRALTINSDFAASSNHPGTPGKGFFQRAAKTVRVRAPRTYARAGLTEPLRRNF